MKVYLQTYSGNVQQNPLCVESCFTKEYSISPGLSPTMFGPVANSVLLRAHLCTAVYSMRRKPWVRNCSRERKGMYNGNVQQNPLCAVSCFHLSPVLAYVFLSRGKSSTVQRTDFFKASHGRLKSQRDGTGGKLTVDPPFSFRRERGTGKI